MSRRRTPLVLLPAMLCDGQLWARQIMDLSTVAAVSLADLTQDDTIAEMARRTLAQGPDRFAAAGVGLGGHVALEMLRQAPERIERIAVFGTRGTQDRRLRGVDRHGALATAPLADPALTVLMSGPAQAMADRVGPAVFERQHRALLGRADATAALAGTTIPTLVAVGDSDRICTVADARMLHDALPSSTFATIAGCGHLAPMERPAFVTTMLRSWLRADAGRPALRHAA
ncbi:hypothetical protein ASE75_13560 [Sphingomonas sp. Leaf17]|uniref:alpha/beta fold hydrolase n=1 Tax=Sphingomonas sp. Leaf17 TaxID=1735683 RepID=UPI0006F5F1AD|nr:alpha/beta fold hydrolase [Sphingomonas sp. Leaf17]KQM63456.1 hypothetical protein ASE75_13560 [Sphingomonas sp. Leaf17]